MTDPIFGKASSLDFDLLRLACWHVSEPELIDGREIWHDWHELPHDDKIRQIIQVRADLFYQTGEDFGFSLIDWRNFFYKDQISVGDVPDYDRKVGVYPYPPTMVEIAILSVINDPSRPALEAEALRREGEFPPQPNIFWPGEADARRGHRKKVYDWNSANEKYEKVARQWDATDE